MARPRINIDREQFEKLCSIQCTLNEIASWFKCSEDTIEKWCKREMGMSFTDAFKKYSVDGKISLRRWQFKMAEHNSTMAIWLGKQYLGQKDIIAQEIEATTRITSTDEHLEKIKDLLKDVEEE